MPAPFGSQTQLGEAPPAALPHLRALPPPRKATDPSEGYPPPPPVTAVVPAGIPSKAVPARFKAIPCTGDTGKAPPPGLQGGVASLSPAGVDPVQKEGTAATHLPGAASWLDASLVPHHATAPSSHTIYEAEPDAKVPRGMVQTRVDTIEAQIPDVSPDLSPLSAVVVPSQATPLTTAPPDASTKAIANLLAARGYNLPTGWEAVFSKEHMQIFFFNEEATESQWERPQSTQGPPALAQPVFLALEDDDAAPPPPSAEPSPGGGNLDGPPPPPPRYLDVTRPPPPTANLRPVRAIPHQATVMCSIHDRPRGITNVRIIADSYCCKAGQEC